MNHEITCGSKCTPQPFRSTNVEYRFMEFTGTGMDTNSVYGMIFIGRKGTLDCYTGTNSFTTTLSYS